MSAEGPVMRGRKGKAKFNIGQVVSAWKGIRMVKIAARRYRMKGDEFDGWWYSDTDEQEYFECELRALTARERGVAQRGRKR